MRRKAVTVACLAGIAVLLAVTAALLLGAGGGMGDRAYELDQRLRCPVCKSVSIADSPSETATAMRQAVQEQVAAGRSDQQVLDFFRARYGDWVLLDPPARGRTLWVWLLPAIGLLTGAGVLTTLVRHRRTSVPLLPEESRREVAQALEEARRNHRVEDLP
ncbi:cytochrome c-type biogenesis protein [Amycolatopsis sp. NPDC003865]